MLELKRVGPGRDLMRIAAQDLDILPLPARAVGLTGEVVGG